MYSELFDNALHAAVDGATVITENRRASRQLMAACQQKLGAGSSAWQTPDILPLDAWLQRTWEDCVLTGNSSLALLRQIQQHALWKSIIMSSKTENLMDLSGTIAGAQEAWALLQQYAVEYSAAAFDVTPETRAFFSWAQQYSEVCTARSWCDFDCLPDRLGGLLSKIRPLLRQNVVFYGFDSFTPQQHSLLNALRNAGVDVRLLIPGGEDSMSAQANCVGLPDAKSELHAAAQWARTLVQSNPRQRIGIVVANMARLRADVEHIFTEVLHPEDMLVENLTAPRAFDVSLGPALDRYPIVQIALLALQTALSVIPTADASVLIRSPYIAGGVAESSSRACFDLFLRGHAGPEVTVEQIKAAFTHPRNHTNCAELRRRMSRLTAVSVAATPVPPSRWTSIVGNILQAIGWPGTGDGGRTLNSAEYQATQAWSSLLSEFSTLDEFVPPLSANQMLAELRRLAATKLFKPENVGAPVQAMGVLEATGSVFDHLWVCGLSDDVWPARGSASPFLPLALQRAADVPHSRPAQDMEFAQRVTRRLSASAPRVVFSWPRHEEGRPLRVSPVLIGLPQASLDEIVTDSVPKWADLQKAPEGESYVDDRAPEPSCTTTQPGGTQLFKLQSNCAFRAFVELRLSAKRMDEPEMGIRPVDRGKIVEKALEILWNQLHDHSTLQATPTESLDGLIIGAVDEAMTEELAPASPEWEKRYRELQRLRFASILREWLECEKRREPFEVVEHQRPVTIAVNGVEVSGRIDRIDRLVGDGSLVILDYKSGNGSYSPGQWNGERPQEPQLPLYVLNQKDPVSAVAFAVLRTGECGFKGYGTRKEILGLARDNTGRYFAPGETFEQHIQNWEPVMESIADGYRTGVATVDPKPEKVCEYCHVTPLCRRADDRCEADDDEEKEQDDVE